MQYALEEVEKKNESTLKFILRRKKKVVEKMWLSNKKGMSSEYQTATRIENNKKNARINKYAVARNFSLYREREIWETHLDNNKYVGHIFSIMLLLRLLFCYYLDIMIFRCIQSATLTLVIHSHSIRKICQTFLMHFSLDLALYLFCLFPFYSMKRMHIVNTIQFSI